MADVVPRIIRDRPDRYMFSMCRTVRWLPSLRARPKMGMERSFMSQFLKSRVVRHGVCNKIQYTQIASHWFGWQMLSTALKHFFFPLRDQLSSSSGTMFPSACGWVYRYLHSHTLHEMRMIYRERSAHYTWIKILFFFKWRKVNVKIICNTQATEC